MRDGRLGRAWLAIREDELAAEHDGRAADADQARGVRASARSPVASAGVAFAVADHRRASPDRFNFSISIILLAMVVLGGMGNVWGVIIGALVIAWFNSTGLPQGGNAINAVFGIRTSTSRRTTS